MNDITLLIPDKPDPERDAVAAAWTQTYGPVRPLDRFWAPPASLAATDVRLYGNDTFCLVLARKLGPNLLSPPDDLIASVPARWLQRDVAILPFPQACRAPFPVFVKPLVPKLFKAAVYPSPEALGEECDGLDDETPVICSTVMWLQAEARAFALRDRILDCATYEGTASLPAAMDAATRLALALPLPANCVLDLGLLPSGHWVFIEANATWGAGLNGCSAARVPPAIAEATARTLGHPWLAPPPP